MPEEGFEVWGVRAGQVPYQSILLGTYYTQGDADEAQRWLEAGRAWTNLQIRQVSQWLRPEGQQ